MVKIGIVASQLTGVISIQGADQAKTILLGMADNSKKAQDQLNQLQNAAKDVGSILSSRLASDIKSAQSGLQDLGTRASAAGLDVSKFTSLQQKASEAAAKLGVAQAQAASAQERANAITNDGSASAEKIALAQAKAALAAENVQKAEMAAADAMSMVQGEATRLADALEMAQSKGGMFSGILGGLKTGASGFFGAISEAPTKLMEATQKIGFFIFGVQQIIQTGQQVAGVFVDLGKKAGDFQQGITQLSTGAGELNSNLGLVSAGLLKMAPEVGESTKELESGMYLIESSGQHGADALRILKDAAEGAKVGNADLADVANGVTTALTDYAMSATQSSAVTNDLIATVASGKTTMGALASSLKDILPIASSAGISLNGVSSAMATMTGEGVPAGQAADYLRGMVLSLIAPSVEGKKALANIGLSAQQVASEMRDSLPDALQMVTDHLKKKFPEGSAAYTEALKQITGGSESLTAMLDLTGDHMKVFQGNVENIYQAVKKGGTGIAGWSEVQKDFNFQMEKAQEGAEVLEVKLGTKLFPVFSQVFGWVSSTALPALSSFSDWFFDKGIPALEQFVSPLQTLGHWFQDFVGHGQAAIPILAGIGAVIATLLVPAVWSLAAGVVTATWPFLLIGGAVAGVTAIFLHFYNTNAGFRDFINGIGDSLKNLWNILVSNISPIMHQIGDFISGTFAPVWAQLQDVWKSQLQPSLQSLQNSFKQLMPVLQVVGEIIGGILLADIGYLVALLGGLIGGVAGMAHGVAEIFGGLVQGFSGFVQTVSGIISFIIDLFTGRFDKISDDLKVILGGIGQIFSGFGNTLKGIVDTIVGTVTGAFSGMAKSAMGYLNDLVDGVDNKTKQARDNAAVHSLEMKNKVIQNAIDADNQTIQKFDDMRQGIIQQLSQTKDEAEKKSLEIKLTQVTHAEEAAKGVKDQHVKMRQDTESELDKLKASMATGWGTIQTTIYNFFGGIGKWFQDRWHDVQGAFGTTGQWFHDRWSEAWAGVTSFFGSIGKWFGDRWKDVQNVFTGIGKWFGDRWSEVMDSTKPFRDYMGAVFETIWNILVALWGKLGQWFNDRWGEVKAFLAPIGAWFHDRWTEAWNATTAVFGAIGKWFGDRWVDVQNIFKAVGQWFHDRWSEAWAGVVAFFGPIGKWFQDRWVDTQNVFKGVGKWFHDRFTEAWNKVTEVFGPIGKWFGDKWNEIKINVSNKWKEIKTDTSNIFKDIINGIIDQLNNGINAFASFINFFGQKLDDLATSLGTKGTIPMVKFAPIPHYASGTDSHPGGPAIVGERGPELVFLPKGAKVATNDITKMLLSMTGGKIPGYADGIGDLGSQVMSWISGGAKSVLSNLMNMFHISTPKILGLTDIASGMFSKVKDWALGWIDKILPHFDFGGMIGQKVDIPGNLQSWIMQAMALTGAPGSWASPLAVIAMHESGGNPNAINLTDSNALAGHPSQGIMQTIPSTFAAYALPGHTNILNPVDNISAAIGYIRARYGDVFNVPGIVSMAHGGGYVGYANGGVISEPITGIGLRTGTRYAFGERGKELVTPYVPSGVSLSSFSGSSHMPEIHIHNHHYHHLDGKQITGTVMTTATKTSRRSGPIRS